VEQPLYDLLQGDQLDRIQALVSGQTDYSSVRNLKWLADPDCRFSE
jgi:hypothetical protein